MSWRQFVFSPDGFDQTALLIAARREMCTAVLALNLISEEQAALSLKRLGQNDSQTGFAVSVPSLDDDRVRELLASATVDGLATVVLTDPRRASLGDSIRWCRQAGLEPLVEVTNLSEALHAVECGAEGLFAKGSESGGRISEETTFILLQRILPRVSIPVYARGGIGLYTASACLAAGAAGVALDWQLALADESSLPEAVKARIARMDGSETAVLAENSALRFRAYSRIGETAYFDLKKFAETEGVDVGASDETILQWSQLVDESVRSRGLLLLGQDAVFARGLADEFRNVRGICRAIRTEASRQVRVASRLDPLGENAPLAKAQGTRFPILQGPMTRVSDNADFALAVAKGGAVPYLALALMRGPDVAKLFSETRDKLGGLPWGAGILGFVPKELRDEQMAEVRRFKPAFMVIAGGRPDMAKEFEKEGMQVYLHVPSPGLAQSFLESGARRLIFEGRECGGHVGPRTSFVLWEQMIRVLLRYLRTPGAGKAEQYHIVFAGGLHDACSAAMLGAIMAPLAERGVRVGAIVGTGYLFTTEIVESGAITATFQEQVLACQDTVLVESGVGHATRCADSQFAAAFAELKRRLTREGKPKEEIREELEKLNMGRLRIASKGTIRGEGASGRAAYQLADAETVRREGMFMAGQVAALRNHVCSVEQLHREVGSGGALLKERARALLGKYREEAAVAGSEIAIVGLSCVFPQSGDVTEYWQNILQKRYLVREIPRERFDVDVYFNADRRAKDKIYSKWGGFLDDVVIDPMKFGMPPSSLSSIDPLQLVTLELVQRALQDAGYSERRFDRENTCCVVGTGGGVGELGLGYGVRSMLPYYVDQAGGTLADSAALIERMGKDLPEWTEDSFAGLLLNVVAGRVANRFDFGGTNFIVDAACATGLAALRHAVTELETYSSDVAVVAAADMMQSAFTYLCFSKTQALSPTGEPRVFDETADGIVISEGIACAVLKRLDDALLDGDRIYGLVKSVGASSDGKDKGLTAPRPIGQIRALERAYKKAAVDPQTVGLIEAHGTGTAVGDRTEAEALGKFFRDKGAPDRTVALGSVKSMIGHAKCAAGFAGFIKATMAMRHHVLPATLGVTRPNAKAGLDNGPLYVNSETRPWLKSLDGAPRRAGISAFGFGGTNFHVVAEEFRPMDGGDPEDAGLRDWPAELFLWKKSSAEDLAASVSSLAAALQKGALPSLVDLASAVCWEHGKSAGPFCLAIVAQSLQDLAAKLQSVPPVLQAGQPYKDPKGTWFSPNAGAPAGKITFAFPGQGSQSVGMMNDLAVAFSEIRDVFEEADASLGLQLGKALSSFIFPPPVFSEQDKQAGESALKQTNVAQPALGAADMAMFRLLRNLGIQPDFVCGHSYGEFAALAAAGTFTLPELIRISELRGRVIVESSKEEPGTMAAVEAGAPQVATAIKNVAGVVLANLNGPSQTVISGTRQGVDEAVELLKKRGIKARAIPVACAFHSPLVASAGEGLLEGLNKCNLKPQRIPVYSNTTASPHSEDTGATRRLLADHLAKPVHFMEEIRAMHEAGSRIFIECGPGRVLTGLISSCLEGTSHIAVHMDQPGRPGLVHLVHALAQLSVAGVSFYTTRLFEGRVRKLLTLERLVAETTPAPLPATAWVVSNGRAVPAAKLQDPAWSVLPPHPDRRASGVQVMVRLGESEAGNDPVSSNQINSNPIHNNQINHHQTNRHPISEPPTPVVFHSTNLPSMTSSTNPNPVAAPSPSAQVSDLPIAGTNSFPASATVPASQIELVMQGHHRLMSKFLDTHRSVVLACLQPQAVAHPGAPVAASHALPTERLQATWPADVAMPAPPSPRAEAAAPPRVLAAAAAAGGGMSFPAPPLAAPLSVVALPVEPRLAASSPAIAPVPAAVAAFVPAAVAAAVPAQAPVTREETTKVLLELVSQRTGYPVDSLDVDLDLEGELGVDSIKRVEILSALQSESVLPAGAMEGQIETLSKLKTLRAIVDWIDARAQEVVLHAPSFCDAGPVATALGVTTAVSLGETAAPAIVPATRLTVVVGETPLTGTPSPCPAFLLITNDKSGVAEAFSCRLHSLGVQHALIEHSPQSGTDLGDAASVEALVRALRAAHGPIGGLVHLLPFAPFVDGADGSNSESTVEARTLLDLRSLHLLARSLEPDVRSVKGGVVLSATRLGGAFGFGGNTPAGFFPGNGVISGFIKTIALEWAGVMAKTVDFDSSVNPDAAASALIDELLHRDEQTEIGYAGGTRRTLRSVKSPLTEEGSSLRLDHDSVVLITGGARGITADTAMELAEKFQPRLVLLGRSPLPAAEDDPDIAGITDARQLRAALMDRVQTGGQRPSPAVIEGIAKRIRIDREIRRNLAQLRALGSEVEYHSGDVADARAVGQLIGDIYRRFGRLDGVVHGAGLIEDKLIGDKTPESFDRVVRPKIAGALALAAALRPEKLQFLVFFSSVSARYGNRGQCDYASANEFLNKLAVHLNSRWPGRVVSLNWGPWKTEGGMVSDELAARFAAADVELIGPAAGRQAFLRELLYGRKQDAEVLFGGPLSTTRKPADGGKAVSSTGLPLGGVLTHVNGSVLANVESHPDRHVFLHDHRIDGKFVMPMVVAMEMLAEVAVASKAGRPFSAVRNLRNLQGITYPNGSAQLQVKGVTSAEPSAAPLAMDMALNASGSGQVHYRARVEFGGILPPLPPRLKLTNPGRFPLSIPEAYEQWLFHGPLFAGISEIIEMGDNGIIGRLRTVEVERLIRPSAEGSWLMDPVITDSSLQLVLLWARAVYDQTALPSALSAYHHVNTLHEAGEILCEIEIASQPGNPTLRSRHVFYDAGGLVLGWMEGMESTMSKSLNRIALKPAGASAT